MHLKNSYDTLKARHAVLPGKNVHFLRTRGDRLSKISSASMTGSPFWAKWLMRVIVVPTQLQKVRYSEIQWNFGVGVMSAYHENDSVNCE